MYGSKRSFRDDNNLHVSILVLDEAIVWHTRLSEDDIVLNVRVHLADECDITITNEVKVWGLDVLLVYSLVPRASHRPVLIACSTASDQKLDASNQVIKNCPEVARSS